MDARALLRAHRAENRIKHPLATYSDAGKLFCKLCQDAVKTESLWDMHTRSQSHRQRLQALQQQQQQQQHNLPAQPFDESTHKRKRSENADEPMLDADQDPDTIRTKRSKLEIVTHGLGNGTEGAKDNDRITHTRRPSGTLSQGVEIAIPSRPATPLPGSNSAVSTPKVASIGRSPLVGSDAGSISGTSASAVSQQQASKSAPKSTDITPASTRNTVHAPSTQNTTTAPQTSSGDVDEAEWAAFEAEMSALDSVAQAPLAPTASGSSHLYADSIISAPAMTTAQVAAKSQEEEIERRKQAAEAEIADQREEATRTLENEFEEMEELEGRVRRLKERREELRRGSSMNTGGEAALKANANSAVEKENIPSNAGDGTDEDDDDDDYEEDEWDGFRFRP
ncbi:hypothetical protein GGS21DRAFT_535977 [Xylaria nigripes]|nr:hypothetical protein GGS21DRAFT_535977 [Xylaria nigripes]